MHSVGAHELLEGYNLRVNWITRNVNKFDTSWMFPLNQKMQLTFFQASSATDPVVQWSVQWPNDITILNLTWGRLHQYAKIAQESNVAPRKRSPPNGEPEQSGVLGLL